MGSDGRRWLIDMHRADHGFLPPVYTLRPITMTHEYFYFTHSGWLPVGLGSLPLAQWRGMAAFFPEIDGSARSTMQLLSAAMHGRSGCNGHGWARPASGTGLVSW